MDPYDTLLIPEASQPFVNSILGPPFVGFNTKTDGALRTIIRFSVQTASYTSFCALVGAILSYSFSANSLNANSSGAFWLPLSSLYAIALISTLNSRLAISNDANRPPYLSGDTPHTQGVEFSHPNYCHTGTISSGGNMPMLYTRRLSSRSSFRSPPLSPRIETRKMSAPGNGLDLEIQEENDASSEKDFGLA
ncbi:hypothetical protein P7C70_g2300, partial [Phenoliferia sp. Uapishka_3]